MPKHIINMRRTLVKDSGDFNHLVFFNGTDITQHTDMYHVTFIKMSPTWRLTHEFRLSQAIKEGTQEHMYHNLKFS